MIAINFRCRTQDEMFKQREKIHDALVGSPAYVNSEIAVCDGRDDTTFVLFVGNPNENNTEFDLSLLD